MSRISLCALLILSLSTIAFSQVTFNNLSIYSYPNMNRDTDPINLYNMLISKPVIPKTVIFKILDVSNTKQVLPKAYLVSEMLANFPSSQFNFAALINVAAMATGYSLTTTDADNVFAAIQNTAQLSSFSSISIDAEPVYNWNSNAAKIVNSIDFHIRLIELINTNLSLPVSVYFSPAKIANNKGIINKNPTDWNRFLTAIGTQNTVFLPAYSYADDPVLQVDIANAITALGSHAYQLIFDSRDDIALQPRLEWAHANNYYGNGTVVYSLEIPAPLQNSTMQLIGNYLTNVTGI